METPGHKSKQITFYAHQVDFEEEIVRPRGYPRPVQHLLELKITQALGLLPFPAKELTALVICGGAGMDAEKLVQHGFRVTITDLSPEAIARAEERSRRYGVDYQAMVMDAESLAFPDRSFDVVFVHDGLHHLPDPYLAIREMARVARRAVVIVEPQDAPLVRLAVRLGISGDWEDAGNFVYRLRGPQLARFLADLGFPRVSWVSHLIYYQPWTFGLYAKLSREPFFSMFKMAFSLINALVGRWGNSLKFTAWRDV
jgi:ubiquinone/menaquinone biosynthesis C-methylase UbiE